MQADGMGLGKTITTIALIYTLLQRGEVDGEPVRRVVVTCPCSLVGNWDNEFNKWINSRAPTKRARLEVKALTEGQRCLNEQAIEAFLSPSRPYHVLVVSYETLRANMPRMARQRTNGCDVLVADEAQRLKNSKTQLNMAIATLPCKRRILLTGTPLQNNLDEFHAMADVANPGILGPLETFREQLAGPILASLEPNASTAAVRFGKKCQENLAAISRSFVLRRENRLNACHLPPKLELVVCCRMPVAQAQAYERALGDKQLQHALAGKQVDVLKYIDRLKKLCDHPDLVEESAASKEPYGRAVAVDPGASAKMAVLYRLMREMRRRDEGERIVIVANATSSLDLISRVCAREGWPWCMLDGKTPVKQRKELNVSFNDPTSGQFAFLLSSTAGGCG